MAFTLVFMVVASMLVGLSDCTASLSVMVNRGQDECFYIPKGTGDTITASFQVYTPFTLPFNFNFQLFNIQLRFHSARFHSTRFHSRIILVAIIQLPIPKWFLPRDAFVIILCI